MNNPRASTDTLGREEPRVSSQPNDKEDTPEEIPDNLLEGLDSGILPKRLIIAVDFGTTYSAVSYVALEEGELTPYLELDRIRSIQNFPDDWNFGGDGMKSEVPTEVIYPLDRGFRENTHLAAADEDDDEDDDDDQYDDQYEYEYEDEDEEGDGEELQTNTDVDTHDIGNAAEFNGGGDLTIFGEQNESDEDRMSIDESNSFRWGYGVHEAWALPATHSNPNNQALSRFKLLLDSSPATEAVRNNLRPTLLELETRGIIKNPHHVIVDFLTCLLQHTKSELRTAGFDESYRTEIVLCVPAIWEQKACRDMQTALAKAMEQARFEGVDVENNSIDGLFIVSEPEAAAAYVLATEPQISVRHPSRPVH